MASFAFTQQSDDAVKAVQNLEQYREGLIRLWMNDFGNLGRYREANAQLALKSANEDRVVFMGDSITDIWKLEKWFPGKPYVNRGIGGQTTPQMLIRFRPDVIDLDPKVVVILAGTNDIAGNTGPMTLDEIEANLKTMAELARLRPDWSFALVGPVGPGEPDADISAITAVANIHLLGPRSYGELPDVLRAADAGLIPYARNALTESIFPMKVYEYLAAGLPVVATPLPALADLADVTTAGDPQGLAELLDDALSDGDEARRAERSGAAASHSWDRRLEEIAAAIDAL